ncbi:MAG: 1-deoxy-D-xylulose-5-phosphate reductoisomerase [Phycisphaerales bacterium]|jgi:1-deoxy-D-xylulose-5-phosphate reductoisomerase|nr:1-deoxy-D-xylulose-5-phosphate reductoisomerase [Phycisphaerales bacterium]
MSKRLFILGSTGSIGRSTVEVVKHLRAIDGSESWPVIGLAAGSNVNLLKEQADALGARAISISTGKSIGYENEYESAVELLKEHAEEGDLVVAAIVGFAGIYPVLTAIELGCDIALANKETLVAGGKVVMDAVANHGVKLLPVDSEHSAIFQSLCGCRNKEISKIILTASGGSLRKLAKDEISSVSVEQVLKHPTWNMGAKVTVDSASLMNKGLELIEAHWLFGVEASRLDAIIHPQSIVHGMVEFCDGSLIAQMSPPDMRLPIQYALTWPERVEGCSLLLDWSNMTSLEFEQVDHSKYPAVGLAFEVIKRGGTSGAVYNAANEEVVLAFLEQTLPFTSMVGIVEKVLENISINDHVDFKSVVAADDEARMMAREMIVSTKVNS